MLGQDAALGWRGWRGWRQGHRRGVFLARTQAPTVGQRLVGRDQVVLGVADQVCAASGPYFTDLSSS